MSTKKGNGKVKVAVAKKVVRRRPVVAQVAKKVAVPVVAATKVITRSRPAPAAQVVVPKAVTAKAVAAKKRKVAVPVVSSVKLTKQNWPFFSEAKPVAGGAAA